MITPTDAYVLLGYGHPNMRGRYMPHDDRDAIAEMEDKDATPDAHVSGAAR